MQTQIKTLSFIFVSQIFWLNAQETERRVVPSFNKIETSGSLSVKYTHADSISLIVKANGSEIKNVETKVENNTLYVSNKGRSSSPIQVLVSGNELKQVQSSGASSFRTTNTLKQDSISFSVSGAAHINATLLASKVKSIQSGASLLTLAGSTDLFSAELSGASSLKAYALVSKQMDIIATGASSSKIYVSDRLKANASGASDIKVRGEVKDISAEASSAASISRIADDGKSNTGDSTVYTWKGRKVIIIDKDKDGISLKKDSSHKFDTDDFKHWAGISVGVNGYMSAPGTINLSNKNAYMDLNYGRSFNFQFNLFEKQFKIVRNNLKIVTGFGIDYHSYQLSNKTNLNPDTSYTYGRLDSTNNFEYKKNRLRNTYLQIPLLIELNSSNNPAKSFHIAFGVIGQYLIASRTKQILEQNNFEIEKIRKDNYNMSPFAAKAHVNFGYRGFTVFGEYSLTTLFQAGKGPELYPFSVGIRVIPFS